ncbi:MAG: acyl-CoA desaturase [Spirochaetia bacterium]|nr:acyl-CoA desaturase [Spirochaetia bacterium]
MVTTKVSFPSDSSLFFKTLKTRVEDYFTTHGVRPTGDWRLAVKMIVIGATAVTCYASVLFLSPPLWLFIPLCLVFGLSLAGVGFNMMHDGSHGSFSRKKWVNWFMAQTLSLMGASAFHWKTKHNTIHHTYTNIAGADDDIDIQPWMRADHNQPRRALHRFQHFYGFFLYAIMHSFWILFADFSKYFSGRISGIKLPPMGFWDHVIFWMTKITYVALALVLPIMILGVGKGLLAYALVSGTAGFVISVIFQLAHVVEKAEFPEPKGATGKMEMEWAVHQVRTTANFSTRNPFITWFVGGLNFQVTHHLFPKVSHIHYPKINGLVKKTCEEFKITYNEYQSIFGAVWSHLRHLRQMGMS